MEEKKITITAKQLAEASARAASNVIDHMDSGKIGTVVVMVGALLNSELINILFHKDTEEKPAGDAE